MVFFSMSYMSYQGHLQGSRRGGYFPLNASQKLINPSIRKAQPALIAMDIGGSSHAAIARPARPARPIIADPILSYGVILSLLCFERLWRDEIRQTYAD